jgi:prophage regulatory protein
MNQLPKTGLLRLSQILPQEAITEEQAEKNIQRGKGPKRPRSGAPGLIPIKKSCWWAGVASGRFPKPVKLGNGRGTFWRVEDIIALIQSAN